MKPEGKNVFVASLGCDKNLVDTERMLGLLHDAGYELVFEESQADIILVNTCCFIGDAKEESIQTILELAAWKEERCRFLIVTGCLAERYREEVLTEMPEVDAVLGTSSWQEIVQVIRRLEAGAAREKVFLPHGPVPKVSSQRLLTTGGHYAYLKIAEGCDKHCTYCVIPGVRGHYRSVPMEDLLEEAERLVRQGVRELILVAQETTLYGADLYGEKRLPELLRRLSDIPGLVWIRLQYCYPEEITPELVEAIRTLPKVCHYLDIPVQHASDRVLARMGRKTSREQLTGIITYLREQIPDIALRTTLITGFPGETEEDFRELLEFVDESEFDRLGVFPYSREEGTPADAMPDQIPEEVKLSRRDEVMELQQEIALQLALERKGRELMVIVDGYLPDERVYACRTYMDSPDVDGLLFVASEEELMTGDVLRVRVTGAAEYDLLGEMI